MNKLATVVAITLLVLLGAGGAEAVTWDFACTPGPCSNNLGVSTKTYTVGANSLIVSGFDNAPSTPGLLTEKNDGSLTGEESGVGLTSDTPDHEILPTPHFVRVDLGAGNQGLINWQIDLGSIQPGETYSIFTSNTNNVAFGGGTACETSGTNSALHALCAGAPGRYVFITGGGTGGADIELTEIRATPVPEPATMFLAGIGLILLGYGARRRLFGR